MNQKLLDEIAEREVDALLSALKDPEKATNPQILARVRAFLKDNELKTTPETSVPVVEAVKELPVFSIVEKDEVIELDG